MTIAPGQGFIESTDYGSQQVDRNSSADQYCEYGDTDCGSESCHIGNIYLYPYKKEDKRVNQESRVVPE